MNELERPNFDIPTFSGFADNAEEAPIFLRRCKQFMVVKNIPERTFLDRWLPALVSEVAWQWLQLHKFETFAAFEAAFVDQFVPSLYEEQIWEDINAIKQYEQECAKDFVSRLQRLWVKLISQPSEEEQCRLIVKNAHRQIKIHLIPHHFAKVADCLAVMRKIELALEWGKDAIKCREHVPKYQSAAQSVEEHNNRRCYKCGRKGHIAKSCWFNFEKTAEKQGNDQPRQLAGGVSRKE